MLPGATDSADDPLEQDAPDHPVDDPAIVSWFLGDGDRANPATDLRVFTTGNLVQPLIDGRSYFARRGAGRGSAPQSPGLRPAVALTAQGGAAVRGGQRGVCQADRRGRPSGSAR